MNKKTIRDIKLDGRKVIMRVDFNVPLEDGEIADDTRIRAALPTVEYALARNAALILMSHLGRPGGKADPALSLKPVAAHLESLLGRPVQLAPDCIGEETSRMAAGLAAGEVLMLENTRFHAAEEGKGAEPNLKAQQRDMARQLAEMADVYVNDAFGAAHRAHASTAVIADFIDDAVAGLLLETELEYLGQAMTAPERPFVAIIGGAKISGKLEVIESLIGKVDTLIVAGGMAYTFFKAQGRKIGTSLCEDDLLDTALATIAAAEKAGVKFLLPLDNVIADDFDANANTDIISGDYPDDWMGMDIGPQTIELFSQEIAQAKTIVWNGPMGCFEMKPFAAGTNAICQAVADADAVSIIGGGDSVSAVNQSGLADQMSHISTGGGASLEFLEGKTLPGAEALDDK